MTSARRRGRPRCCPDEVLLRIVAMHHSGIGYRAICRILNEEGTPTAAGRPQWYPSYVWRLLNTANVIEQFGRPRSRRGHRT
ncbi:recombinase family protein [Nocardia sp. NPDC004068]|uniref:recombinase family protein n=1 Tax=Nocardia sp. NPDC004068 TaxID=3364303 RepID=UPI0036B3003D